MVCRHQGLLFQVHPARWKILCPYFEMEKITLIFIYLTLITSLLRSASGVYFLCNVHATIMALDYFNPDSP